MSIDQKSNEYQVERILQRGRVNSVTHYLVKWKGYSEDQSTWEPITNLEHCTDMIVEFETIIADLMRKRELQKKKEKRISNRKITAEQIFPSKLERSEGDENSKESIVKIAPESSCEDSKTEKVKSENPKAKKANKSKNNVNESHPNEPPAKQTSVKDFPQASLHTQTFEQQIEPIRLVRPCPTDPTADPKESQPVKKVKREVLDLQSFEQARQDYDRALSSDQIPNHKKYRMQDILTTMQKCLHVEEKEKASDQNVEIEQKANLLVTEQDQSDLVLIPTKKDLNKDITKREIIINKAQNQISSNQQTHAIPCIQRSTLWSRYARGMLIENVKRIRKYQQLSSVLQLSFNRPPPSPIQLLDFASEPQIFTLLKSIQLDSRGLTSVDQIRGLVKLSYGWNVIYGREGKVERWSEIGEIEPQVWDELNILLQIEIDADKAETEARRKKD